LDNLLSDFVRSFYKDYKEELKIVCFKFIIFVVLVLMLAIGVSFLKILPISGGKKIILEEIEFWGIVSLLILFFLTAIGDLLHIYRKRHQKTEASNE